MSGYPEDRLEYRVAIARTGKRQYQIAHSLGWTEWKLSMFLTGRGSLKPAELARLESVLGMETEGVVDDADRNHIHV